MPEERGLYPKQAVLDQLVYLGRLRGTRRRGGDGQSVTTHLERLGLADRARDHVEKLSLGNQQRVQIIAALMGRPRALVLDEPFSGLDPAAVDNMADLLREHTSRGVPVLFSSHQLDLVERLCERLVVLVPRPASSPLAPRTTSARTSVARHRLVLSGRRRLGARHPGRARRRRRADARPCSRSSSTAPSGRLLEEALRRGEVHEFSPQRPSLAQIYREVTA